MSDDFVPGYHLVPIEKGVPGEFSKIREEFEELVDALNQKNALMVQQELSDLIGAIELFLEKRFAGTVTLDDLLKQKDATSRAFKSGQRK